MQDIGARVRRARRDRDLTQQELAARAGTTYQTVSRIERGRVVPKVETVTSLAAVLGVRIESLLRGDEPAQSVAEDEPEREAEFYDRTAATMEASARDMLARLRELESLDTLSAKDRAFLGKEIPKWEKMIRTWERRRGTR